jgi:hypothetical protein
MTIRSALSSAVIFAGVAAALAGPARADQAIFEGDYTFTGGGVTRPWHATPCGVGYPCTHIDAPPAVGKAGFGGDAHIANVPFWIMTVMGVPDAVGCGDGSAAPGNVKYQWDSTNGLTLYRGTASIWTTVGVCGDPPKSYPSVDFTLTQVS